MFYRNSMVTVQDLLAKEPDELSMEDLSKILESDEADKTTDYFDN